MNEKLGNPMDEIGLLYPDEEFKESNNTPQIPHPLDGIKLLTGTDQKRDAALATSQEKRLQSVMTIPVCEEEKVQLARRVSKHYPAFERLTGHFYENLEFNKLNNFFARLFELEGQGLEGEDIAKILPPSHLVDQMENSQSRSQAMKYISFINMGRASFATRGLRKQGGSNEEITTAIVSTQKLLDRGFTYKDMNEIISHSAYNKNTKPLEVLNDVQAINSIANMSKKSSPKDIVERFKKRDTTLTKAIQNLFSEKESSLSKKRKATELKKNNVLAGLPPSPSPAYYEYDPFEEISEYSPETKKVRFTDTINKNESHTNGYLANGNSQKRGFGISN